MWKKGDEADTVMATETSSSSGRKSSSTIGSHAVVVGEFKGQEDLIVLGTVDGTVSLPQNTVTVGKSGTIKGTIESKTVLVEGSVEGDLKATDKVVLRASAKVKGNIAAGRLVMEDGCYFQGGIDMIEAAKPAATPKPAAPANVKPAAAAAPKTS